MINRIAVFILGHGVEFAVHLPLVASAFLAAMLAVLLAAYGPAQRAANLELATSIQYE